MFATYNKISSSPFWMDTDVGTCYSLIEMSADDPIATDANCTAQELSMIHLSASRTNGSDPMDAASWSEFEV